MGHLTPDLVRAADDALAALDATLETMMEKWFVHTRVDEETGALVLANVPGRGEIIVADCWDSIEDHDAAATRATLIAAAPELVEALREARTWLSGWGSAERELEIIDAALTKAGVSP